MPKSKSNAVPSQELMNTIATCLNDAQKSNAGLRAATSQIKDHVNSHPELYTSKEGLLVLAEKFLIAPVKKDAGVSRVQQIFADLLLPSMVCEAEGCSESAFIFLNEVLKYSAAADKGVRLQVCRVVCNTLDTIASGGVGEISDKAWALLRETLLPRLRDKQVVVRSAAARAFQLLQNDLASSDSDSESEDEGEESRDEATLELLRLASGDTSKEVRIAATMSFQLSAMTLPHLVNRTKDVSHEVRIAAIERIGNNVHIGHLTSDIRVSILFRALTDRHEEVVAKGQWLLVDRWLRKLDQNFNITKLLDHLALGSIASARDQDCASICANTILDAIDRKQPFWKACLSNEDVYHLEQSLNKHAHKMKHANLSQMDEITPGDLILLRVRAERAHRLGGAFKEDELENILPEMAGLAELIGGAVVFASEAAAYCEQATAEAEEVNADEDALPNSPLVLAANEAAKEALLNSEKSQLLAQEMLRVVPLLDKQDECGRATLTATLCDAVLRENTPEDLVDACVEATANLSLGIEGVDTLHNLVFQFGNKISASNGSVEDKKWWEYRLSLALSESLKHMPLGMECLGAEVESALMSLISNEVCETRERAVQGLGRLCLLSESRAQRFLPVLFNISVASSEVLQVRGAAVQGLMDVMMVHESCAAMMRDPLRPSSASTNQGGGNNNGVNILTQLPEAKEWSNGLACRDADMLIVAFLTWLLQEGGPMACLAAESTSKLIMNQRLGKDGATEAETCLLNTLVGLYFTAELEPSQDAMTLGSVSRMQQVLTIFFKVFPPITQYSTLRRGLSSLVSSYLIEDKTALKQLAPLSKAILLYIDMLEEYELATKESKQSKAYVVLELCRGLRTSSSSSSVAKAARKEMVKLFASLEVPCLDANSSVTDNELLKLVTLWCSQTASHLTNLDGVTSAKPIRKFALACADFDETPEESLPSELVLTLTSEHLRETSMDTTMASCEEVALMLADSPTNSSQRQSSRRSTTSKRSSTKSSEKSTRKHTKGACEAEEEEDEPCGVCGKTGDDDKTLLCEGCDGAYHMFCLSPPLSNLPEGDWFCPTCSDNQDSSQNENDVLKEVTKTIKSKSKLAVKDGISANEESKCQERHVLGEINA